MIKFKDLCRKIVAHKSLKRLLDLHGFWTLVVCISTFIESSHLLYVHLTLKYLYYYELPEKHSA